MDLIIRQAATPERDGLWDVAIQRGHIAAIVPRFEGQAREEIQADGDLLSPGFVDAHMHLDKSLVGENLPFFPASSREERIELARKVQWKMTHQSLTQWATNQVRLALSRGTTTLCTHVDIDPAVGLKNFEGVLELRERCRNWMNIQIVAFPQSGILRAPGTLPLLREALGKGAEVIGGIDPAGFDGDIQKHIDLVFELAQEYDVDVDIHLHDPGHLGTFTLWRIAENQVQAITRGSAFLHRALCTPLFFPGSKADLLGGTDYIVTNRTLEDSSASATPITVLSSVELDNFNGVLWALVDTEITQSALVLIVID